jgi:predicted GH43/DUF377 family glycosyl hydrolase
MLQNQPTHPLKKILEEHLKKNTVDAPPDKGGLPPRKKGRWTWKHTASLGALFVIGACGYLGKTMYTLERKQRETRGSLRELKYGTIMTSPLLGGAPVPIQFRNVPLAETDGIVLSTKVIPIRHVLAPYNGCIFKKEGTPGYQLIFRYDQFNATSFYPPFFTYIGVVELDENLEQTAKEFQTIDTHSDHSEDARIVKLGKEYYLSYNDMQSHSPYCRSMRIAHLNLEDYSVQYTTNLDLHLQHIEKNWSPFEYIGEDNKPRLLFEYYLSPHKILELPNPQVNAFNHWIFPDHPSPPRLPWNEAWGHPRGGTAPQRIGEEYLGFFHSSFTDPDKVIWYVIGAYTFEAKPPFRITSVSKFPILFNGIYGTHHVNTATRNKMVIFPTGFVIEERDGKELIQLSCGENDSSVKILTIDKEALLKNMINLRLTSPTNSNRSGPL